jgi:hypothetical protein
MIPDFELGYSCSSRYGDDDNNNTDTNDKTPQTTTMITITWGEAVHQSIDHAFAQKVTKMIIVLVTLTGSDPRTKRKGSAEGSATWRKFKCEKGRGNGGSERTVEKSYMLNNASLEPW